MSFLGRAAAIGGGALDRALSTAEIALNLRERPTEEQAPTGAPRAPFFPDDYDWNRLGLELSKSAVPTGFEALDDGPSRSPRALASDPFQMIAQFGYKERPSGLAYTIAEQMVRRTPVIQAIIQTRATQVARHCRVQRDNHAIGYRVLHRDRKANLTRVARREAEKIETALSNTTFGEPGVGRHRFAAFTYQLMVDSLTHDQVNYEIVPSRRGRPYSWTKVDAKTIRLADTAEQFLDPSGNRKVRTVQVLDGQVINEWPASEMAFRVRNPQTSITSHGYGRGEVEMLLQVITALLWAVDYNKRFFSQGSAPKGILNFKGQLPGRQLAAFRRFFYQMLSGVENSWKTPILNADQGAEWLSMHSTNRDMEYGNWLDFLIKLASAMFLMDSAEIGFKYGNENDRSLFESANEQKITMSKDKGLKPLLTFWSESMNETVVQPYNPDFEMVVLGLDALTPREQAELNEIRGRTYVMLDELREEDGRPPLEGGMGRVINSPTWMQFKMTHDQMLFAAQQQQDGVQQGAGAGRAGQAVPPADESEGGDLGDVKKSMLSFTL